MGEACKDALRLDFDHKLRLEFHGTKVTSDAGLLAYRELDEALGLTSAIDSELRDIRTGKNTQHGLAALLRQSIYSRPPKQIILDMDSSVSPTYGNQEGSAYNLGNFLRRLALPKSVKKWSLRTLCEKLIKIGAKVVMHSRYIIFQMAEVAVPRALIREILDRIRKLRSLPVPVRPG